MPDQTRCAERCRHRARPFIVPAYLRQQRPMQCGPELGQSKSGCKMKISKSLKILVGAGRWTRDEGRVPAPQPCTGVSAPVPSQERPCP